MIDSNQQKLDRPLEVLSISKRLKPRHEVVIAWCQGPQVLSLGCAQREYLDAYSHPYWLHRHLTQRFPRVVGVDIDHDAVQALQAAGYEAVEADVESFDLAERFNTVVAGELIEHLSNPGNFLEAVRRHLLPGARLILTTPNPFATLYVLNFLLRGERAGWNTDHTLWMDAVVGRQLLERHGYRVIKTEYATDYSTRPGDRYRWFVSGAHVVGRLLPTPVLKRLFANNVVLIAEPR